MEIAMIGFVCAIGCSKRGTNAASKREMTRSRLVILRKFITTTSKCSFPCSDHKTYPSARKSRCLQQRRKEGSKALLQTRRPRVLLPSNREFKRLAKSRSRSRADHQQERAVQNPSRSLNPSFLSPVSRSNRAQVEKGRCKKTRRISSLKTDGKSA